MLQQLAATVAHYRHQVQRYLDAGVASTTIAKAMRAEMARSEAMLDMSGVILQVYFKI